MRGRRWWLLAPVALLAAGCLLALQVLRSGGLPAWTGLWRTDRTWATMQARGVWRVGMDPSFPPFEYLDANGVPAGLDVDLAQRVAQEWGLKAEIVAIGFDSLLDAVKAGKVDTVVSAYPYDERLTQDYAFSTPYYDAGIRLVARQDSPLRDVHDLAGKRVAVEWGSTGDMIGRRLQREGTALTLAPLETPDEVVAAAEKQQDIAAALIDNVTLGEAQANGARLKAIGGPLESVPYVMVSSIRATDLQQQIDAVLRRLRDNKNLEQIEQKWFAHQAQPAVSAP